MVISVALLGVAGYRGLDALGALPSTASELADIAAIYAEAGIPVRGPRIDDDATESAYRTLGGEPATCPLLVQFSHEDGQVIFTSFHNEKQNSQTEQELLQHPRLIAHDMAKARNQNTD